MHDVRDGGAGLRSWILVRLRREDQRSIKHIRIDGHGGIITKQASPAGGDSSSLSGFLAADHLAVLVVLPVLAVLPALPVVLGAALAAGFAVVPGQAKSWRTPT